MEGFSEFVTKNTVDVYGSTTINHRVRVKLGLSTAEYVAMDFIEYAFSKRKMATYEYAMRRTGFEKSQFLPLILKLRDRGFVETKEEDGLVKLIPARLWLDAFMIGKEWFESFWNVRGKPWWPGSRKDAEKKFEKLCKVYSPEYIIQCKEDYVKFIEDPVNDWRKKMAASVFLNPDTERFREEWRRELKEMKHGVTREPIKPKVNKQEKDQLFE